MDMLTRTRLHRFLCISGFLLVLILSACASTAPQSNSSHPHSTAQQSKPNQIPDGPLLYVAQGASDAVGVGSKSPGSQGYVPLIAGHVPKGSHLINLGISGIRLHQALSQELPLALTTSPNLVTVWLVANDFVDGVLYNDYTRDLNTLLQRLHTSIHARIVMADLPDLSRLPAFANQTPPQKAQMLQAIQYWNKGIAQLARKYNVVLLDLFSHGSEITAHPAYISFDGFHPSALGYAQLANYFWQAIKG